MKVAFVTNLCPHYRYKLFNLLAQNYGFDFYFFDNENGKKIDVKHLHIFHNGTHFRYANKLDIYRSLLFNRYDVIFKCTNNKLSLLTCLLISVITRAKFIVWHTVWYYPDTMLYRGLTPFFLFILKNIAHSIVVYGEHGKNFLSEMGVKRSKIHIAWQAVENELYGNPISKESLACMRKGLSLENKKVVLYVGRLVKLKGIEYLLEALSGIERDNYVFIAIGDGELKDEVLEYCNTHDIDFRLLGQIPYNRLSIYYKLSDVLVLPSITTRMLKEAWGLVVNEAFNQGCPAIVTCAVGAGAGGLVKDGENGFIVPERDSVSLCIAIRKVLENPSLRDRLSTNAMKEIEKWTYERQAEGFINAIKM